MPGTVNVVHVDPDERRRDLAATAFRTTDAVEYVGVSTTADALDCLADGPVDAVVTGGPDAISVLRSVRAAADGVATIVVSDSAELAITACNAGADRFVDASDEDWPETLVDRTTAAIEAQHGRTFDRQAASILDSLFEQAPDHIHLYVKDEDGVHIRVTDTIFDAEMLLGKPDYGKFEAKASPFRAGMKPTNSIQPPSMA